MRLLILFYCLVASLAAHAEEATSTLPEDAQKAEAAYEAEVVKILNEAAKDVKKAKAAYAKELEKEMKDQLKKNGIVAANEVQSLLTELEKSDPLTDKFGQAAQAAQEAEREKENNKQLKIVIQNAYARKNVRNSRVWNLKDDLQKALNSGTLEFRPYELFKKVTGFDVGGRLDCQFTINGKRFERSFSWRQSIDFEKIAEEE